MLIMGLLACLMAPEGWVRAQGMPMEPAPPPPEAQAPEQPNPSADPPATRPTRNNRRQQNFLPNNEQSKRASAVLKTLTPISERVRRSVGVIVVDGKDAGYATVVRADGYMVTKASELNKGNFLVRLEGAKATLAAKIIGIAEAHDLALIKVETANLAPVEWADPTSIRVGQMVVTVGADRQPLGVGVISVGRRPTTGGFLGVSLLQAEEGIRVMGLEPGKPAQKAGIQIGDIIIAINDQKFAEREDLSGFLQLQSAGTEVSVTVRRGEEELVFRATLVQRPLEQSERARSQNNMGSELSNRRTDFPAILQHDTVLQRWQQGGPMVDLDGKVIGINIARAGRVETYALPVEVVEGLIPDLLAGVYPAATQPAVVVTPVDDATAEVTTARAQLKSILDEVEKGIRDSEGELDKLPAGPDREQSARDLDKLRSIREELMDYQRDAHNADPKDGQDTGNAEALAEHAKKLRALAEVLRGSLPATRPSPNRGGK